MDQRHGSDPIFALAQGDTQRLVTDGSGLHAEKADDDLQTVFDAMVDLPKEHFFLQGLAERLLGPFAFDNLILKCEVCFGQLLCFIKESHENGHFGSQDFRVDGFAHVVHPANAVASEDVLLLSKLGSEKQDRNVFGFLAAFDEPRQFQTVNFGHLDIEHNRGDIVLENRCERLIGVLCPEQTIVRTCQNAFEHIEVSRPVIHQEDVCRLVHHSTHIIDAARPGAGITTVRCSPAWQCSPTLQQPYISRGHPSWPSPLEPGSAKSETAYLSGSHASFRNRPFPASLYP